MSILNENTYSKGGLEKLDYSMFDTLPLAAAGTDFSLFQQPIGAGAVPKTLSDTNMTLGGMLPSGQAIRVRAIKASYMAHAQIATATLNLIFAFLQAAVVRVFISGKDAIYCKPLAEIMGVPLLAHLVPTTAGDTESVFSMGRFLGVDPLNVPISLDEMTNFEVRVSYPTALGAVAIVGDFLRISLNGVLLRRN